MSNIMVMLQIHMDIQDGSGKTLRGSDCNFSVAIRADSVAEAIEIYNDLKTTGKKLTCEDTSNEQHTGSNRGKCG